MDDSSDDEIGKPQNVGMDSSDEEPPSTKQSVTTAPAQVNMLDDLLGMDMPQTQPTNTGGIGGLGDLDFGTTTQAPAQSNDLLGDMMGGMSQPAAQEDFGGFGGGFGDEPAQEDEGGAGWADAFEDEGFDVQRFNLGFAANPLKEVVSSMTPGNKQKKAGLGVEANLNYNNEKR